MIIVEKSGEFCQRRIAYCRQLRRSQSNRAIRQNVLLSIRDIRFLNHALTSIENSKEVKSVYEKELVYCKDLRRSQLKRFIDENVTFQYALSISLATFREFKRCEDGFQTRIDVL